MIRNIMQSFISVYFQMLQFMICLTQALYVLQRFLVLVESVLIVQPFPTSFLLQNAHLIGVKRRYIALKYLVVQSVYISITTSDNYCKGDAWVISYDVK